MAPPRLMLPEPVQSPVPPFSKVRVFRVTPPAISKAPPVSTIVGPLPPIVPEVHTKAPRIVSLPLPVSVGRLAALPSVTSAQSAGVFNVTVTLFTMTTLSFELGTRLGVQFVALFQSPPARFVQVKMMGVNRAY